MSVDKYKITRLINRKPIEISKMQNIEKDGGIVMNYHKTVITQIVEAQEKVEFECICAEIQKFIEENNIDICYVINKSELVDCLQEHQILKLEISDLEAKLETKEKNIRILTKKIEEETDEWIAVRDDKNKVINKQTDKINELKQQLAEKDKEIEKLNKRIKKQKEEIGNKIDTFIDSYGDSCVETGDLWLFIENKIEQLKEGK